jgi:hypothetical protein
MDVFTDSKVALRDAIIRPSKRLSSWELLDLADKDRALKAELDRHRSKEQTGQQEKAFVGQARSRPERLTVNSHRLVSPYYVGRVSVGCALVIRHWLWPLVRRSVTPPQLPRTTTRTIPTPFTALLH